MDAKFKEKRIRKSIGEVGFCEYPIALNGDNFKLWGGPDCLELGDDGMAEVVDYKSRLDIERGKANLDITLMSKIYVLLCAQKLLKQGHKKARFVIRFWQDPFDESFFEEFDVTSMSSDEFVFRQKIEKIIGTKEFKLCENKYCAACKSEKKSDFLTALNNKGYVIMSGQEFKNEQDTADSFLPF